MVLSVARFALQQWGDGLIDAARTFTSLGPFCDDRQRCFEAMARPSSRRVARKIRQAGRSVLHETINRWRRQGWRPLDGEPQHPLEIARDHLDDAVPVLKGSLQREPRHPLELPRDHLDDALPLLTGDPMSTAESFLHGSADRETLKQIPDDELLRRAAREVLKVVYERR